MDEKSIKIVWRGALAFFVLAGLTGAFFRFALVTGSTAGLEFGNVRHAHSHTMYFGWATPALMALIAYRLPRLGGKVMSGAAAVVGAAFVTALIAYPPFLLSGYGYVAIGDSELPLSMIAAGLNVIAWYLFVGMYIRSRRDAPGSLALRLLDLALFLMLLATLGAWGLPLVIEFDPTNDVLKTALTHFFLDLFSEGWFVLAVLGLAAAESGLEDRKAALGAALAAIGIPFAFVLGITPALVPPTSLLLARIGGVVAAIGFLLVLVPLWRAMPGFHWRFALGALAAKVFAQVVVSVVPGINWAGMPQLRVLYLHVLLLGFVSVGIVAAAKAAWPAASGRNYTLFGLSVAAFLISLIPLTPVWPMAWRGVWVLWFVAVVALAPVWAALRLSTTRM